MQQATYAIAPIKSRLWEIGTRLYRMRDQGVTFDAGLVDLSRISLRSAASFFEQRRIAKAILGKTIVACPEILLKTALKLCGRLDPPIDPDVIVILRSRDAEHLSALILEIYARCHLPGFEALLVGDRMMSYPKPARRRLVLVQSPDKKARPQRQTILIARPTDTEPQIILGRASHSGTIISAGDPLDWPQPLLRAAHRMALDTIVVEAEQFREQATRWPWATLTIVAARMYLEAWQSWPPTHTVQRAAS